MLTMTLYKNRYLKENSYFNVNVSKCLTTDHTLFLNTHMTKKNGFYFSYSDFLTKQFNGVKDIYLLICVKPNKCTLYLVNLI